MVDRYVPQTVSPRIVEPSQRLHRSVDAIQRKLTAERQAPQRELMAAAIVEGQRLAHRQPTPQIDAVGRPLEQPPPVVDDRLAGARKALGRKPRSQEELHEALWAHDETLQSDQLIALSLEYQAAHGRLPSVPNPAPVEPTRFLGVDLGIVNIATDSDGNSHTGDAIEVVRQRASIARQTYQSTHTKSAKRRLKRMAGKQARFQRAVNHSLSKRLVAYAKDTKAALVLEDLTHIRDRIRFRKSQRSKQHHWSFRQLRDFLVYKAQRAGVPLLFVDPRTSSRTCSRCGYVDRKNRRSQADFSCLRCGYATNADRNTARNLATRGLVSAPDLIASDVGQLAFAW